MTIEEYNKSVADYSDSIYRFILKNVRDTDKSKDIVQDTYERLWVRIENVNYSKVKSYLFTTAYHALIDQVRKDKKQTYFDDINPQNYSHDKQYSDINEILHEAIERLPEDQRSVILLRDYEGYSYKEISDITGLSEPQVKVYIYRGRLFLKKYIGKIEVLL